MSQKITSKNLSYDTTLPPFLARLHGQHQQHLSSDSPDPILAARRRPRGHVRSASEEAEDAPLVVDERGNVVQVDVDEESGDYVRKDGTEGEGDGDGDGEKSSNGTNEKGKEEIGSKDAEKVAGIGAGKKRKVGRVVGGEEDDNEDGDNVAHKPLTKTKNATAPTAEANAKPTTTTGAAKPPPKKKAKKKKIQLSFGDDGDGE